MTKPVLVVMAAGMGSRYGGPKQMDPVGPNGQLIIDYSIYDAHRAGFDKVIFIIKREIEADFKQAIGDRLSGVLDVRYAYQELGDLPAGYSVPAGRVKPWGTTHAVLAARELIDGPFAVLNSDDYYGPQAFRDIYGFLSGCDAHTANEYAMIGYRLGNTVTENGSVARGICQEDGEHYLTAVVERTHIDKDGANARYSEDGGRTWTALSGGCLVSMNFWGFTRAFLDEAAARVPAFLDRTLHEDPLKGEFLLPTTVSGLIGEDAARVKVLPSGDRWFGVTYREDKPKLVAALADMTAAGRYPENLWK